MSSCRWRLLLAACCLALAAAGADPLPTPLTPELLDPAAFAEWCAGTESPIVLKEGPKWVLWTTSSQPGWSGVRFGALNKPGPRHLRLGFKQDVPLGTLLVQGGAALSILKPGAAYPGDLADESQWLPAARLTRDGESAAEGDGGSLFVWTLPPGTRTRALRFTHVARVTDQDYAGSLGAAAVLAQRWANAAVLAQARAEFNERQANRLNNSNHDGWGTWRNEGGEAAFGAGRPTSVTLTWEQPRKLLGINVVGAYFATADVQVLKAGVTAAPQEAEAADWITVRSGVKFENQYPRALALNWVALPEPVETRALRLLIASTYKEAGQHPHLQGKTQNGRSVQVGEIQALVDLQEAPLASLRPPPAAAAAAPPHPPIPVRFTLDEGAFVTLVIEDRQGVRVRNLIAETWFPAGRNVAWWDGCDDLGRDVEAARHGLYHIPEQLVAPGEYRVRGLARGPVELRYEFAVYSPGDPPWPTPDHRGGWLSNHCPPMAAAFVPAGRTQGTGAPLLYLGCLLSEGPDGLALVDLDGNKVGGRMWIGGLWTSAPYLACDTGPKADPGTAVYVASAAATEGERNKPETRVPELRITAVNSLQVNEKKVAKLFLERPAGLAREANPAAGVLGGLAARDGRIVCALTSLNRLLAIEAASGKEVASVAVPAPAGLAFDAQGALLVVSGTNVLRFSDLTAAPATLIGSGLEAPAGLTVDADGRIYVSDRGNAHQVKIFSPAGELLGRIGRGGLPAAGPYDPLRLDHPRGLAVDNLGRLWVTEESYYPKRVSVWSRDGQLLRAFYGPSRYGGGGALHPGRDRFFLGEEGGALEFSLDWERGTWAPANVLLRPDGEADDASTVLAKSGHFHAGPEAPFERGGRTYLSNCFNASPTNGADLAGLYLVEGGRARAVAALGRANDVALFKTAAFKPRWPDQVDLAGDLWRNNGQNQALFLWSDANGDGRLQPEETSFAAGPVLGVTVLPDLSLCVANYRGRALRLAPLAIAANGVPSYDLERAQVLAEGVARPVSSGGGQVLAGENGLAILTLGVNPFSPYSLCGTRHGVATWSYPSVWPGLHPSHEAGRPEFPGELIGTTRLLGGFVKPVPQRQKGFFARTFGAADKGVGEVFAVNGNMGNIYLLTSDGLFLATLFHDIRLAPNWRMPAAERGMRVDGLSLHDENFWPTITQTRDGGIYLVDGARSSLVRVDGLETARRLPDARLTVTPADLAQAALWRSEAEAARQAREGTGVLRVARVAAAPAAADWEAAYWCDIDKRGVAANFNSDSRPYDVRGALLLGADRLYARWRTANPRLLENSGETAEALFKTGGALDLMLGSDPAAAPGRREAVAGDLRLLVALVKGQPRAMLYRAVVPGTPAAARIAFSSPSRSVYFDQVQDVTAAVTLSAKDGDYELAIPLALLGLAPAGGQAIRGDMGVLRGAGGQTTDRVYWSNKATGIVSDVPSEALLMPQLWGRIVFE